jgi:hypothetical protein
MFFQPKIRHNKSYIILQIKNIWQKIYQNFTEGVASAAVYSDVRTVVMSVLVIAVAAKNLEMWGNFQCHVFHSFIATRPLV